MSLALGDFAAFHGEVHGCEPFPWQERLLKRVVTSGWPKLLDLPTGSGKTTCVDIALFALALDAAGTSRRQPCRIAMVVDRRIVVDQVAERGRKLLAALVNPVNAVAQRVATSLRALCGADPEEDPVGVYTLRGGIPKDDGWARDPSRPLILASTVDQIGSRLLIQGYGVSDWMRPVHAGLVGNDLLLLLDEVHLSQPFAETLQQIEHLRSTTSALPTRFCMAFLSATPGLQVDGEAFGLGDDERAPTHRLGRRLHARKPAKLVEEVSGRTELEVGVVEGVRALATKHHTIAAVVNRVGSARTIARNLREALGEDVDVALLTGRMRPLDRDDALRELRPRLESGRRVNSSTRPLVVVATQCIEAGADFDFDALVTECASLDALRQRFGRVDRLGEYGEAEAWILFDKENKDDPVYGGSVAATWKWLHEQKGKQKHVDFGVVHMRVPASDELEELVAPKRHAPVLLPAYLDLWMQTWPRPAVVPEPSLWLHGPASAPADVQIVWRVDVSERSLADRVTEEIIETVASIAPCSLEALPVPFVQAKRWLLGGLSEDVADVERVQMMGVDDREDTGGRLALRWRGDASEVITARDLRPGDTIVVPAERGGIAGGSFDPEAVVPVADLAERAMLQARGWPMLRLHADVLAGLTLEGAPRLVDGDDAERRTWFEEAAERAPTVWLRLWLSGLARARRPFAVNAGEEGWQVVRGPRLSLAERRVLRESGHESCEDGIELTTDVEDSYHAGRAVGLDVHSGDVEMFARRYARAAGLSDHLVSDVALAGYLHDVGKADPRFQLLLCGGDEVELARQPRPLAKSGMPPEAKAAHRLAARRSGYPRGTRHEVMSVAMLAAAGQDVAKLARDFDLVLHLVGSHHGYCRPFAPAVEDPEPRDVQLEHRATGGEFPEIHFPVIGSRNGLHQLDSPLAQRFWELVEKFGWWGLCWLEALLRLADHRASEKEQQ